MNEAKHKWRASTREGLIFCVRCGVVRNLDRKDSSCKGRTPKIEPRIETASPRDAFSPHGDAA